MSDTASIADHWGTGDVYSRIVAAMKSAGLDPASVTVEQLAPVDHFHARGFPATRELADALPFKAGQRIVDIGSGVGGPARYLAQRFQCHVDGIDITKPFVEAANKLTELVGLSHLVSFVVGDGQNLPFDEAVFDGGYSQHVTMNVPDRGAFFREAFRVLKPAAFFAITEHGLGEIGNPRHPLPWSKDGTGAFLMRPSQTVAILEAEGFIQVEVKDTGDKYVEAYNTAIALAQKGQLPALGTHVLLGEQAPEIVRNAARNIEEGRTHPVQITCRKPG